ncbi:MAG TPA: NUDIX hydrolase [Flavitalea sp.]|nr:NUDIX hydrolase [Flavitalea sp.]
MNNEDNPWQILSQKQAYDNPWISVTEFDVINPAGGKGIYGKVHFKNLAIGILPLDEEMNTWLVGQYRFPIDQYSWEIPEGGCPEGMDPLSAARRELAEETGLTARSWQKLMEMRLSNSVTNEQAIVYLARELEQHAASPEETEQLTVQKIPFEQACKMAEEGGIADAISVAAILKVKLMLSDGRIV